MKSIIITLLLWGCISCGSTPSTPSTPSASPTSPTPSPEKTFQHLVDSYYQDRTTQPVPLASLVQHESLLPIIYTKPKRELVAEFQGLEGKYPRLIEVLKHQELLETHQFDELTQLLQAQEKQLRYFPSKEAEMKVLDLYATFVVSAPQFSQHFEAWIQQDPTNSIPWIARGIHRVAQGWRARGTKYISDTPVEQRKAMGDFMRAAEQDLLHAIAINPHHLAAHLNLMSAAKSGSAGDKTVAFYAGRKYFKQSHYLVERYASYLQAKWGGRQRHWQLLAAHLKKESPHLLPIANSLLMAMSSDFNKELSEQEHEQMLNRSFEQYPTWFALRHKKFESSEEEYKAKRDWIAHQPSGSISSLLYTVDGMKGYEEECIGLSSYLLLRGASHEGLGQRAHCLDQQERYKEAREVLQAKIAYAPTSNEWAQKRLKQVNRRIRDSSPEDYDKEKLSHYTRENYRLDIERDIGFYARCQSKQSALSFSKRSEALGYAQGPLNYSKNLDKWFSPAIQTFIPTKQNFEANRLKLTALAESEGCGLLRWFFSDRRESDLKMLKNKELDLDVGARQDLSFYSYCATKEDAAKVHAQSQGDAMPARWHEKSKMWRVSIIKKVDATLDSIQETKKELLPLIAGRQCSGFRWTVVKYSKK